MAKLIQRLEGGVKVSITEEEYAVLKSTAERKEEIPTFKCKGQLRRFLNEKALAARRVFAPSPAPEQVPIQSVSLA